VHGGVWYCTLLYSSRNVCVYVCLICLYPLFCSGVPTEKFRKFKSPLHLLNFLNVCFHKNTVQALLLYSLNRNFVQENVKKLYTNFTFLLQLQGTSVLQTCTWLDLWFARDIWRYRNVFWLIDWPLFWIFPDPPSEPPPLNGYAYVVLHGKL